MAGSTLATLPFIVLFFFLRRQFTEGFAAYGTGIEQSERRAGQGPPGRSSLRRYLPGGVDCGRVGAAGIRRERRNT